MRRRPEFSTAPDDGGTQQLLIDVQAPTEPAPVPVSDGLLQKVPVDASKGSPRGYTGTTCPTCKLAQWTVPSGVRCPNAHYYSKPGDPTSGPWSEAELAGVIKAAAAAHTACKRCSITAGSE